MGLSDREYMRPTSNASVRLFKHPVTWTLIGLNVIVFLIQNISENSDAGVYFLSHLVLSKPGILAGHFWTLATCSFLHVNLFHLVGNSVGLWCAGRFIEDSEGGARVLWVYWGGVILGALCWLAIVFAGTGRGFCVGASAGVSALFAYMLLKIPEQVIRMVVFIFPLPAMRAKTYLRMLAGFTVFCLAVWEIPKMTNWWRPLPDPLGLSIVAHSAHLGGILWGAGMILFEKIIGALPQKRREKFRVDPLKQSVAVRPTPANPNPIPFRQSVSVREPNQREIDRILDKISARGIASLTDEERAALELAGTPRKRKN